MNGCSMFPLLVIIYNIIHNEYKKAHSYIYPALRELEPGPAITGR